MLNIVRCRQIEKLVALDSAQPDVVRVKVKQVSDEIATVEHPDHQALQEATTYLHEQ